MALLNTHTTIKKFIQHGFSEEQAEVVVEAINDQNNNLVTKQDLINSEIRLESKIDSLESKIDSLDSKIDYEVKAINANFKWMMAIGVLIVGILLKREIGL